jgi:hypothetical protein
LTLRDLNKNTLEEIWNGKKRLSWLKYHKEGNREKIQLCKKCEFWGVPTSL